MPLQLFSQLRSSKSRDSNLGSRQRPVEVGRSLTEFLDSLDKASGGSLPSDSDASQDENLRRQASEGIQRQLRVVLEVFENVVPAENVAGDGDAPARSVSTPVMSDTRDAREEALEVLQQLLATEADLPVRLVASLGRLDFEVRKDVLGVISGVVRLGPVLGADSSIQDYAKGQPRLFKLLVGGLAQSEVATHCGMMLRSCARHRGLVEAFFATPGVAIQLLSFTGDERFDVSSDAFSSLHDFVLTHKSVSASFLEANFGEFFKSYNALLQSDDYVTQRQALKLLSEILLDRTFMKVMLAYIGDEQFLQIHMNLLRADSKAIQFEAFHVFKIFVANPQKPPRVEQILYKNRERLVKLLETLKSSRQNDRQFMEDRNTVAEKLLALGGGQTPTAAGGGYSAPAAPKAAAAPSAEPTASPQGGVGSVAEGDDRQEPASPAA